jgi:hypothetical protein
MSITYTAEMLGLSTSGDFIGYLKNVYVDTTAIQVPLIGTSLTFPLNLYGTTGVGGVINIRLTSPLDSGITGYLKFSVVNLTTSAILGYVYIAAGEQNGSVSTTALSVSSGDQVALTIVSTEGSGFVPFISWEIGEGE